MKRKNNCSHKIAYCIREKYEEVYLKKFKRYKFRFNCWKGSKCTHYHTKAEYNHFDKRP